jgi:tetratricopeptide (TPR) repeat protein
MSSVLRALDAECAFGITANPPASGELEDAIVDGVREFRLGGDPSVRYRATDQDLPPSLRVGLQRFFVYGVQLHPRIVERIEPARAPALLEYVVREVTSRRTVRLELTESAADSTDWNAELRRFRRDPIDDLVVPALEKAPTFEDYLAASRTALEQKNYLDAILAQFEANMALGRYEGERLRAARDAARDDDAVGTLMQALNTEDDAQALKLFDSIDRPNLRHRHVLDVFRANSTAGAGDPARAIELFRRALAANPYLTGAYIDLGGVLFRTYEVPAAWQQWDVARKLAPAHPMLEMVTSLEQRLVESHPRFF